MEVITRESAKELCIITHSSLDIWSKTWFRCRKYLLRRDLSSLEVVKIETVVLPLIITNALLRTVYIDLLEKLVKGPTWIYNRRIDHSPIWLDNLTLVRMELSRKHLTKVLHKDTVKIPVNIYFHSTKLFGRQNCTKKALWTFSCNVFPVMGKTLHARYYTLRVTR